VLGFNLSVRHDPSELMEMLTCHDFEIQQILYYRKSKLCHILQNHKNKEHIQQGPLVKKHTKNK